MRLLPIVLASTCLLPGLLTAQEQHDDLRAEIRKIVREEIRAALAELKGGVTALAKPVETKKTAKTRTIESIAVPSIAKAAAEEVEKIVLSLDDITDEIVAVAPDQKTVRARSTQKQAGKPMTFTLRCADGECVAEEGGQQFVIVQGGEGEECPMMKLGDGAFALSIGGDVQICTEGECGGEAESECCEGGKCCEGAECEAGACEDGKAEAKATKQRKATVRVVKPAEGLRVENLEMLPQKLRRLEMPMELKVERLPVDVQVETAPKTIEVKPLKGRSKIKNTDGKKQDNVLVRVRPLAV